MLFQIIKLSIFSSWRLWHQTDHKEKLYGQRESNLKHKAARPYELFFFAFVFYSSILRYNLELSFFTRRNAMSYQVGQQNTTKVVRNVIFMDEHFLDQTDYQ